MDCASETPTLPGPGHPDPVLDEFVRVRHAVSGLEQRLALLRQTLCARYGEPGRYREETAYGALKVTVRHGRAFDEAEVVARLRAEGRLQEVLAPSARLMAALLDEDADLRSRLASVRPVRRHEFRVEARGLALLDDAAGV